MLELFVENSNRVQVLHQSYLAIFLSRQNMNLLFPLRSCTNFVNEGSQSLEKSLNFRGSP